MVFRSENGLHWVRCGVRFGVIAAGLGCVVCGSASAGFAATRQMQVKLSPWEAAVKARAEFEAEPAGTHTKAEYTRVMDGFRVIYHADPGDVHAARAVEQVAELLAEQGKELGDAKSLSDSAGQYAFLVKAYPGSVEAVRAEKIVAARPTSQKRDVGHPGSLVSPVGLVAGQPHPNDDEAVVRMGHPVVGGDSDAVVSGIRHWSTESYTRVVIDLGGEVEYQAARVENPDRIFFDLHHAKLASGLAGKSFAVTDDEFLTRIRAAQYSEDVTRVVLDVHEVGEYSAFLLPNPYRLIVDIHGRAGNREQGTANREVKLSETIATDIPTSQNRDVGHPGFVASAVSPVAGQPHPDDDEAVVRMGHPGSLAGPVDRVSAVEVSTLPAMPATDGSAGFGLPTTMAAKGAAAAGRAIGPLPTSQSRDMGHPANGVVKTASENGREVAAVSEQSGKVEATSKPTSQPVVEKVQGSGVRVQRALSEKSDGSTPTSQKRDVGHPGSVVSPVGPVAGRPNPNDDEAVVRMGHPSSVAGKASVKGEPVEAAAPTADGETSLVRALGLKIGRIVIDAGHGGHDSGTLGAGGIEEKDVVLDVALRLGKLLHERLGAEIVYTRADDTFIPLETRTAIANKAQADLFISVHANSSQDASARGVEVYYLNFTSDPDALRVASRENAVSTQNVHDLSDLVKKIALKDKIDESKELAMDVDASLYAGLTKGNAGLRDRGVKKAPFVVLIGANMPSILAEISFVTNPSDAEQLRRPEYRERVAESLYGGVAKYAAGINGGKVRVVERASK